MAKRPRKVDEAQTLQAFAGATVLPSDTVNVYGHDVDDKQRAARAMVLTIARACAMNAAALAQQKLRLYRKARPGSKVWAGKAVKDLRRLAYLRGELRYNPGTKAVGYAESGDVEEVIDHPVLDLLRRPDPFLTGDEWTYLRWWFKEAVGRVYYYTGERVGTAPVSLYTMMPQYTKITFDDNTIIREYRYGRDLTDCVVLPAAEVMYMRHMAAPWSLIHASSWVDSVAQQADLEAAAITAELCRWKQGGSPSMVFEIPPTVTETQRKQLVDGIKRQIAGVLKAGGFLFLQNAKMMQGTAVKPVEMQYVEGQEQIERAVCNAADIPEALYRLNDANLASATVALQHYGEFCLLPRLCRDAGDLTEMLLPLFGVAPGEMWFAYDSPVKDDEQAKHNRMREMVAAGAATVDEWRQVNHMPAMEADDGGEPAPTVPESQVRLLAELLEKAKGGTIPVDAARELAEVAAPGIESERVARMFAEVQRAKEEAEARAAEAGAVDPGSGAGGDERDGGNGDPPDAPGDDDGSTSEPESDGESESGEVPEGKALGCCAAHSPHPAQLKAYTPPDNMVAAQDKFAAELKRWYERAVASIDGTGQPQLDALKPDLDRILADNIAELIRLGASNAAASIGSDGVVDMTRPVVQQYVSQRGLELVTDLPETVKREVAERIGVGLEEGRTINQIQADIMAEAPQIAATRAEVVARTETAKATAYGQAFAMDEAGYGTKRWVTAGSPCPICDALNGMTAPVLGYFVEPGGTIVDMEGKTHTYPNGIFGQGDAHPNCVLGDTPVAAATVIGAIRAHYTGAVVTIKTALGHGATFTANHQVLTGRGWVRACEVNEGDDLVCALPGDSFERPHVDQPHATIEQVFNAAKVAAGMAVAGVPAAPEHLHGDGASVHGHIDVVTADGLLMRDRDPALFEKACERSLQVGYAGLDSLSPSRNLDAMLLALRCAADGRVGRCRDALAVLRGGLGVHEARRVAAAAWCDTGLNEAAVNDRAADAELLRECKDALAVYGVSLDKVVKVDVGDFAGHVYDLTTMSGAYVCNGIVSHNCACTTVADELKEDGE